MSLDALFNDTVTVCGPSGRMYRCRRIGMVDLPAEYRAKSLTALIHVGRSVADDEDDELREARALLREAEKAGDGFGSAAARDAISTVETKRQERAIAIAEKVYGDPDLIDGIVTRGRAWLAASVRAVRMPDGVKREPGPVANPPEDGWADVRVVMHREEADRHASPPRVWAGILEGDLLTGDRACIMQHTKLEDAGLSGGFRP